MTSIEIGNKFQNDVVDATIFLKPQTINPHLCTGVFIMILANTQPLLHS